jgi:putative ABC transport system ATP-binding protein
VTVRAPLRFEGVRFAYPDGEFQLRAPELCVEPGEQVALVGPSGCGKSTVVHLAAGILLPQAGRVLTLGEDLAAGTDEARRRLRLTRLGLVFQEFELLDYLDALENALVPRLLAGHAPTAADREHALELLGVLGLGAVATHLPAALSRGERQRVALCRALLGEPAPVRADEPTASLDPERAAQVLELLSAQCRARETALLLVTHDRSALEHFDRVVDLTEGAPS